ncbi:MAG: sugar transferase [Candidatus Moranbacteria bacterium]|nr:sugar transferase [Candidatus Moranbacteria bacterium]MDD3965073.1 sugar transferase [Candidatus Moranbacteria bacterium]
MIVLAAITAYFLRGLPIFESYVSRVFNLTFNDYLDFAFTVAPFFIFILALEGLYRMRVTRRFWQEAYGVAKSITLGLIILIVAVFLNREWFSSRFVIIIGWFFAVIYVVSARYVIQRIQKWLLVNKGIGMHRVLLIGFNAKMEKMKTFLQMKKELGYRVVDHIDDASVSHIKDIRQMKGIDEIIIGDTSITDDEQAKLFDYCQINNILYRYFPTVLQTTNFSMQIFNGEPIIEFQHTPLDGWGRVLKRIYDLIAGFVLLVLFSPFMAIIALLIKLEDPDGPIIYKNERIGENGKKFLVYKFRYMLWKYCITDENKHLDEAMAYEQKLIVERNTRQGGVLYKIKDDPRKMRVGAFIERFSLDELPQFFNVLEGSMSLVGPRPHQEREVARYSEYHRRLLTIKPGVTGMAQVSGRSDLAFEDEFHLDVFYIENWSLWLDILVCFKTAGALLRRRKNSKK